MYESINLAFQSIIYVSKLKMSSKTKYMSSKTYKIILYVIKFLNYLINYVIINQIFQKFFRNLKLKKIKKSEV